MDDKGLEVIRRRAYKTRELDNVLALIANLVYAAKYPVNLTTEGRLQAIMEVQKLLPTVRSLLIYLGNTGEK